MWDRSLALDFEDLNCCLCASYERCGLADMLIETVCTGRPVGKPFLQATGYYARRGHHARPRLYCCDKKDPGGLNL